MSVTQPIGQQRLHFCNGVSLQCVPDVYSVSSFLSVNRRTEVLACFIGQVRDM